MEVDFGQFYQFAFDALCSILRLHRSEVINRTCLQGDYWLTFQFGYIDPLWVIPMLLIKVNQIELQWGMMYEFFITDFLKVLKACVPALPSDLGFPSCQNYRIERLQKFFFDFDSRLD